MATQRDREREQARRQRVTDDGWASDKSGGFEPTSVSRPKDLPLIKLEEGEMVFDVIPYLAGAGNFRADPGFEYWQREYTVHRIPTPDGHFDRFNCLYATFKESCPVCRYRGGRDVSQDEKDALRPQDRHLLLVNNVTRTWKAAGTRAPKLELSLLDVTHFNRKLGFGEKLRTTLNSTVNEDYRNTWWLPVGGCHLVVTVADAKYQQVEAMALVPRKYNYPDDIAVSSPCLDDMIIKLPLERGLEMIRNLTGEPPEAERDGGDTVPRRSESPARERNGDRSTETRPTRSQEQPAPRRGKERTAEELGLHRKDIVMHTRWGECEITDISDDGTTLTLVDRDDKIHRGQSPEDCTAVKTADTRKRTAVPDEDDAPPHRQARNPGRAAPAEEDEPEDDDDEPEDDEEDEDAPPRGRARR